MGVESEESAQDNEKSDSLEQVNVKVKDMVEAFRNQLRERDQIIDNEKAVLNQFISGLDQDETSESPRKLKAMSLEDLNTRIDELINTKRTEYEKLHEERNQL